MRQGCRTIKIDKTTAIMCGGEASDHKCNEDSNILILSDGSRIENTEDNYKKHYKTATGGSVACSICGRAAIDNAMYMDF